MLELSALRENPLTAEELRELREMHRGQRLGLERGGAEMFTQPGNFIHATLIMEHVLLRVLIPSKPPSSTEK